MSYDPDNPLPGAVECPHCGAKARVLDDAEMHRVCGICGGPLVVIEHEDFDASGDETAALKKARAAQMSRGWWRLAGIGGGLFGVGSFLVGGVAAALLGSGVMFGLGLAVALPFVLLAMTGLSRQATRTEEIAAGVGEAWKLALRDLTARSEGMTAEQITKLLPLEQDDVEQLLAELAADGALRSRITDEGKLRFAPQVRIRTEVDDSLEARFEALAEREQAQLEADAALGKAKTVIQEPGD